MASADVAAASGFGGRQSAVVETLASAMRLHDAASGAGGRQSEVVETLAKAMKFHDLFHRFHGTTSGWEFQIRLKEPKRRGILLIGSVLNGWTPALPDSIFKTFICIKLCPKQQPLHYGYRAQAYKQDDWSTCDGPTAAGVVEDLCEVLEVLRNQGAEPRLSFIGISAGVDRILTVACNVPSLLSSFRIVMFVAIAGAYHSTLYSESRVVFGEHGAKIIVIHHVEDKLCPYRSVKLAWQDVANDGGAAVYVKELEVSDPFLIDRNYHNYSHFLLAQKNFWDELTVAHQRNNKDFLARCLSYRLGEAHLCSPDTLVDANSCDYDYSQFSHLFGYAFCLTTAAFYAQTPHGYDTWFQNVLRNICACNTERLRKDREAFLSFMDNQLYVDLALRRHIPALVFEALFATTSRGNAQLQVMQQDEEPRSVAVEIVRRIGPLTLLAISFPEATRTQSPFFPFSWPSEIETDIDALPQRPYSTKTFDAYAGQPLLSASHHVPELMMMCDSPEEESAGGMEVGDFISMLLTTVNSSSCCLEGVLLTVSAANKNNIRIRKLWLLSYSESHPPPASADSQPHYFLLSCIRLRMHSHVRTLTSWGRAALSHPSLFMAFLGSTSQLPPQDKFSMYAGPPGTGKTTTATKNVLEIKQSKHGVKFRSLSCAWTKAARNQQYESFVKEAKREGYAHIEDNCILVERPPKGKGKGKSFSTNAIQLSMRPQDVLRWVSHLDRMEHVHIFATVGAMSIPSRDFGPLTFRTPIDLLANTFDWMHIDEFGTVLFPLHLLRLGKKGFTLITTGDLRQLPAYMKSMWRLPPAMRFVVATQAPELLSTQHRMPEGLADIVSLYFYEGFLESAPDLHQPTCLQYAIIVCRFDDFDDTERSSRTEAALVKALFHKLHYSSSTDQVLCFYKAQKQNLRDLDFHAALTVDPAQGGEWDNGIVSCGRRGPRVGFMKDRCRLNVALSRWKKSLLIIMNDSLGEKESTDPGMMLWYHLRRHADRMNALLHVGAVSTHNVNCVAENIASFVRESPPLLGYTVRNTFSECKAFFDAYQIHRVGKLNEISPIVDSDMEDQDAVEDIRKEDIQVHDQGEDVHDNSKDDDAEENAAELAIHDGLRDFVYETKPGNNVFAMVSVIQLHKLLHQATFNSSFEDFQRVTRSHNRTFDACIHGFAYLLFVSLQQYLSARQPLTSELSAMIRDPIQYPFRFTVTIEKLASSWEACSSFLWTLFGRASHRQGSPFFYLDHVDYKKKPRESVKSACWHICLPYTLCHILISTFSVVAHYPTNLSAWPQHNQAMKYLVDLPVPQQNRVLRELIMKGPKKQKPEVDNSTLGRIKFAPYESGAADGSKSISQGHYKYFFQSLDVLHRRAHGRHKWWSQQFWWHPDDSVLPTPS